MSLPHSLRWTICAAIALVCASAVRGILAAPQPQALTIDASKFASAAELERDVDAICSGGLRMPGGKLHKQKVAWFEGQLKAIPGVTLSSHEYGLTSWEPLEGQTLEQAGGLRVDGASLDIASAIAYSKPTGAKGVTAPLVFLPSGTPITADNAAGKVVVRDIDYSNVLPYGVVLVPSYSNTGDFTSVLLKSYKRPATAPQLLADMLAAGTAGAAGVVTAYDVPRSYMRSAFTPHDGTMYRVPGVFVGVDEGATLKAAARRGASATLRVEAQVYRTTTRNLYATLPGQSPETVVYVTHTDGVSYVQENGGAALLALLRYFAALPLSQRGRTLQFAFNSGHLHLSREGTDFFSRTVADGLASNNVTLVVPVEHMATREVEQVARAGGQPGSELRYTGKGEAMLWCVGPMRAVVGAVQAAVARRRLDRTIVTRGAGLPNPAVVPMYTSFAGLGSYFHTRLVPTTALISGPWTLWAPSWGKGAVDFARMRAQTLALGDVYFGVAGAAKADIDAGYAAYRRQRDAGTPQFELFVPPESAP